jgi:hypothetical protein
MSYKRIFPESTVDDSENYAVMVTYKDEPGTRATVKTTGTYDECASYVERNNSPDNIESYFVARKEV